jgi:hypothetical protein
MHSRTAQPFLSQGTIPLQIAKAYYGRPANDLLATGQAVCMDCHGTVRTGREDEEVRDGVSCESCHGPAGKFFEPHKNAANRTARLALGIVDLENPTKRAEVCASCHYVTDSRLISSGHPVPKMFDLWERSERIKHWKGGPDAGALRAAFQKMVGFRGPVPQVPVVRLAEAPIVPPSSGGSRAVAGASGASALERRLRAANGQPPPPRPYVPSSASAPPSSRPARSVQIDLPSLPVGLDKRPVAEILRQVQRRLELLYSQTGGGS